MELVRKQFSVDETIRARMCVHITELEWSNSTINSLYIIIFVL